MSDGVARQSVKGPSLTYLLDRSHQSITNLWLIRPDRVLQIYNVGNCVRCTYAMNAGFFRYQDLQADDDKARCTVIKRSSSRRNAEFERYFGFKYYATTMFIHTGLMFGRQKKHTPLPPPSSISDPGVTINPTIIPMPRRELLIAIPAPMLHILQPSNAKGNTAKARDRTNAQRPTTKRKKHDQNQFWLLSLNEEKDVVEQIRLTMYIRPRRLSSC